MNLNLIYIFSFSILIAGIIAIFKFNEITRKYHPFLYVIWIGCFNELLNYFLIKKGKYNIINSNIYGLAEALLLIWFFWNLGVFRRSRNLFWLMMGLFIVFWTSENFLINDFGREFNTYFSAFYSFCIVLFSITAINMMIFRERNLLKYPAFLICTGLVIFYTYSMMVELFWLVGYQWSKGFANRVYYILVVINLFCNLIYALAILWMQKKQAFSIQL